MCTARCRLREKRLVSRKDLGVESNPRERAVRVSYHRTFPGRGRGTLPRWCNRLNRTVAIRNGRRRSGCSIRLLVTLTYMRRNRCRKSCRNIRDFAADSQPRDIGHHAAHQKSARAVTFPPQEPGRTMPVPRRRTLLPCWSWAAHSGAILRQAQDHRPERPGCLHPAEKLA